MLAEAMAEWGGWIGGILGGVIGIAGGAIGTYASLKNVKGGRERSFMIKASIMTWILIAAFVAGMLLISGWYKHLLWIPYVLLLVLGTQWVNRVQARIRQEEMGLSK